MNANNELFEIRVAQDIVIHSAVQLNREAKNINLSNAIRSMKEAVESIDKSIVKNVKQGRLRDD